jgi:hypothetical protein
MLLPTFAGLPASLLPDLRLGLAARGRRSSPPPVRSDILALLRPAPPGFEKQRDRDSASHRATPDGIEVVLCVGQRNSMLQTIDLALRYGQPLQTARLHPPGRILFAVGFDLGTHPLEEFLPREPAGRMSSQKGNQPARRDRSDFEQQGEVDALALVSQIYTLDSQPPQDHEPLLDLEQATLEIVPAGRGHPRDLADQPSKHFAGGVALQGLQDLLTFGVGRLAGKRAAPSKDLVYAEGARRMAPRFRKRTPKATRSTTIARMPKVESVGISCTPGAPETETTTSA